MHSSRGEASESFRETRRCGQLREIDAIQIGADVIRRPREKGRAHSGPQISTGATGIDLTQLEVQIVQGSFGAEFRELDLLQRELIDAQFAFGIHAANEFTGGGASVRGAKQRGKQALQPARTRARADPAVEFSAVQMIGVQLDTPFHDAAGIGLVCLNELPGPVRSETVEIRDGGGAQAIVPVEACFVYLQGLVHSGDLKGAFVDVDMAIPPRDWLGDVPLIAQRGAGGTGQFPSSIDRPPKRSENFQYVLDFFHVAVETYTAGALGKIVEEPDVQHAFVFGSNSTAGRR